MEMRTVLSRSAGKKALLIAAAASVIWTGDAMAQSTWTGATNGEWGTSTNWTGGVPNAVDAVANINSALTVNVSSVGGTYPYTFGTLSNSAAVSVVLGNNGISTDILTAAGTTTPTINVTNGSGIIFFYANLEGTQGFNKTGAGKLTFRFNSAAQTYSGPIGINGGILGITNNGSLGNSDNDLTIANGARLLLEPSPVGTVTLPNTRTFTLGGLQSQIGANTGSNLIINGSVGESVAGNGLVITDGGTVTLAGTIGYTGETRIAGGTLALTGSALLPTSQNLRFTPAAAVSLDVGTTSQTVRTIVMDNTTANRTISGGTGGSLTINGDADLLLSASNGVTYSFAGLNNLTFDRSTRPFNVQTVNVDTVTTTADVNLAKSGVAGGTNVIKASQILIGGGNSNGNNGNTARMHLGTVNDFRSPLLQLGAFNAAGTVDFQSGLTSPSLKLRGTDGVAAMATLRVGETSSGTRSGAGTLDLTGGTLDAIVTDVFIGRHIAGASNGSTSFLTMLGGTLTANTIVLGDKSSTGTPVLTSNLNQGGGTVKVLTLTFGKDAGGGATPDFRSSYNLAGGTLSAATIQSGTGAFASTSVRRIGWTGGTIANYDASTDLSINGVSGAGGGITLALSTAATKSFDASAGRTITLGAFTNITGTGVTLTKIGAGTLTLANAGSVNSNVTVDAGTFRNDGTVTGNVTVNLNGTLQGTGTFTGNTTVNGKLTPGNSAGKLTWSSGNLALGDGSPGGAGAISTFEVTGTQGAANAGITYDNVTLSSAAQTITYDGTLNIEIASVPTAPGTYDLFNFTGAFAGVFDSVNLTNAVIGPLAGSGGVFSATYGGTTYTFSSSTGDLVLSLSAVPEPLTAGSVLLLATRLLGRRDRRAI